MFSSRLDSQRQEAERLRRPTEGKDEMLAWSRSRFLPVRRVYIAHFSGVRLRVSESTQDTVLTVTDGV